jgi:cyanate permease
MFGLVQFSASLFSAFNQNLLSLALDALPWRSLFAWVCGLGVLLLVAAALWLRDPWPRTATRQAPFLASVLQALLAVARRRHVWVAAAFGALCFGTMLALGVVWGPKLLQARGLAQDAAHLGASLLWLGLAAGCFLAPWASDRLRRRKWPVLAGIVLQLASLGALLYLPPQGAALDYSLCLLFGLGNAAHMLAFSTAADVVEPAHIGTSAALVNGLMFIVGGLMISRPGLRSELALQAGIQAGTPAMLQFAARPLLLGVAAALVIALLMRETYPAQR